MKRFLRRLLAVFGLAPASAVASQAQLVAESRKGSLTWKNRAGEATARVKALEAEVKRQTHLNDKLRSSTEKLRLRHDEIEKLLRERLVEAEHALIVAREQLMVIDAKLDILEGAANVLDARTRTAISKPRNETVAPI